MAEKTTHTARPLLVVKDLTQFADENGQLVWAEELIEFFLQLSDFDQKQQRHAIMVFKSGGIEQVNFHEEWKQCAYRRMMPIVVGGTHYGPSLRSGNAGCIEFVGPDFFEQYGNRGVNGWTRLMRRALGLRHRMHLTRGKTLEQWFADGEIFYPTNETNPYTEVVFLELRNGEPHIERIPIHTKELPAVEYVSYRKGSLTRILGTLPHDTDASVLEADLATAAGITERRINHFLYVVRDEDMIARVRQMFGHTDGCYDCNTLKTLAVMFSDHKVKLGHDARYESW